MDLQERINVLIQGAELAQKNGALTIDEAYYTKQAIDALKNNVSYKEAFEILLKIATIGQKKGVFTLRDAHLMYLALENYESVLPQPVPPQPVVAQPVVTPPAPEPAPKPTPTASIGRRSTKKES